MRRKYYKDNKDKIQQINKKWVENGNKDYQKNYYHNIAKKDRGDKPRLTNLTEDEKLQRRRIKDSLNKYNKRIAKGEEVNLVKIQELKEKLEIFKKKIKNEES